MDRQRRLIATLPAAALLIAACGGTDDDAADLAADAQAQADDVLENVADGEFDLEEYGESLSGFNTGEGGGIVTIDGVAYEFVAEICISQGVDFTAAGLGEGSDGRSAWVDISAEDGFEGGDPSISVAVTVGQTSMMSDNEDTDPDFFALSFGPESDMTFELAGGVITGSGSIQDFNGVAIPYGESRPVTFEASCT